MRPSGELITRDDVLAARARIQGYVRRTPLLPPQAPSHPLWLKCEFLQYTGVFKTRGAFNRQLAARERGELDPTIGIVVASGGNAGLANAYAAAALGVRATVFGPETAPPIKIERILEYDAHVRQVGSEYAEAYEAAVDYANTRGALLCHAYDQLEIAAGAGTLAEEILEDKPAINTIVAAVGGGRPVDVAVSGVAADSLGARRVGEIAFRIASRVAPTSVLVSEDAIVAARSQLWRSFRIAAEHGAAAAFAALTDGAYVPASGEKVAVVICGANTDVRTLEP